MMPGTIDEPAEASRRQTEPLVACVMLVNGRYDMVQRALASYRAQTYQRKTLLVLDSGTPVSPEAADSTSRVMYCAPKAIGILRNQANEQTRAHVIAHFDSDDWSHPDRLAEQVAALVVSGAEVVGYRDALFYDSTKPEGCGIAGALARGSQDSGEAWRYCGEHPDTVFGASLLYWRAVWEKHPFPSRNTGEDTVWLMRRNVYALSGFPSNDPKMICEVHGGNTSTKIEAGHREWQRARSWDDYCRERMKL